MRRFWRWLTNSHDTWGIHVWEDIPGTYTFGWAGGRVLQQCKVEGCGAVQEYDCGA